jgi:hypothetical protein
MMKNKASIMAKRATTPMAIPTGSGQVELFGPPPAPAPAAPAAPEVAGCAVPVGRPTVTVE